MSKDLHDPRTSTAVLSIPEPAHFSLVQIAYFVRLMAHLTEPGTNASNYDAILRPNSLGWYFSNLSRELDAIIDATYLAGEGPKSRPNKPTAGGRRKLN
jgi:hypothetical protein